jgi:hypothetical protein
MRVALRKYDGVTRSKAYRRFIAHLDKAITFRNQMEDHYSFGARLQQRRGRVCTRGLVAPGRRKPRVDEDGADQSYDAKRFR